MRLYLRTGMESQENKSVQETEKQKELRQTPFQPQESSNGVSFPTIGGGKKSGGAKTLLIVGILVLVAILGFVIYKSATKKSTDNSTQPSPYDYMTTPSSDQGVTPVTPAPVASPAASVDKSNIKIQVLNGTGISGEAAYLKTQLINLGYKNVEVGNSASTVTATAATFSSTLDARVVTEITQKLSSIYQTVTTSTSASKTFDVIIVTGLRKGATPKPTTTATPVS